MDIEINLISAMNELDIDPNEIQLTNIDKDYLKKKYHKLALKWHPDKNKESYAKEKFQKINEAYDFLLNELNIINEEPFVSSNNSKIYSDILYSFISSLLKGDIIINIIKEISSGYEIITTAYLRNKFEQLDKYNAIELYQLLYKYKDILYISEETLELVSLIIKEKFIDKDRVIILKPNLKDIIDHNIYKLYINEQLYLVPLWHNEMYFDSPDGSDIIVLCQPKLPTNIIIDENNNIYYDKIIKIDTDLSYLIKNDKFVSLEIGEKWFSIPLNKLYLKEEQLYRFKGQGISHISEKDIYNISSRADIIIKIILI